MAQTISVLVLYPLLGPPQSLDRLRTVRMTAFNTVNMLPLKQDSTVVSFPTTRLFGVIRQTARTARHGMY